MPATRKALLAVLALTTVAGGCRRQPPAEVVTPSSNPPASAPAQATTPTAPPRDDDAAMRAEEARVRGILEQMVFFDYDQSSIREDSRRTLDEKIPLLRQHPGVALLIEGHADDRGSTEYNLALGARRAQAVMDYLIGFGLGGQRFRTMSYGEERPLAPGQDESAWSRNRRGEFRVDGGITPR